MSAAPILNISRDGAPIKSVPIEGKAEVGRSEGCLIRLDDRAISRKHALFTSTPGGVQVEKKSDFAPLSVNGVECTRALLKEGDVIEIGPYLMKFATQSVGNSQTAAVSAGIPVPAPSRASSSPLPNALPNPLHDPFGEELNFEHQENQESPNELAPQSPNSIPEGQDRTAIESVAAAAPASEQMPELNFSENAVTDDVSQPPSLIEESDEADNGPASDIPNFESPSAGTSSFDGNAQTKLLPQGKLSASLEFAEGLANVTHFDLEEEVSLGRGKACNIVLRDKKASRKHAIIRRQGSTFVIKDLESANGTYVNGVQITELQLSGDDVIRIGNSEFEFKALSQDYVEQQGAFLPIPKLGESRPFDEEPDEVPAPFPPAEPLDDIAGISNGRNKKKQTLVEKFRALPKRRQMTVGVLLLALFYFVFIDDDTPPPPKKTQKIVQQGDKTATFESLTEEQKKFVIAEHDLAYNYFKDREYDKALYELEKIFQLIPDYKDSQELKRYSKEGRDKLKALEEERRKKEEEEKLKLRVADLVDQTKGYMDKKQYDAAHDLFPQILALDPDNAMVAEWSKVVDRYEEQKAMEEQAKAVQAQINRRAWDIYKEGMGLKKELKYLDAIATLRKVSDIGATDRKLAAATAAAIQACISELAALRDPVLADAKQAEDSQDLPKAFQLYEKATEIDPSYPAGFAGMARIRGVLHDRAKGLYIEAVLAESYSDFTNSKKKFQECMQVAPKDDVYHERAERKLASYFLKNGDPAPQ